MTARTGTIVDIRGGIAAIRVERASACSSCGTRHVCGAGKTSASIVHLPVAAAQVGERVELLLPEGGLIRAALLAYLMPAAGMLLGGLMLAGHGDLAAVAGALCGLGLGLIGLRRFGRRCDSPAVLPAPTFVKPFGEAS